MKLTFKVKINFCQSVAVLLRQVTKAQVIFFFLMNLILSKGFYVYLLCTERPALQGMLLGISLKDMCKVRGQRAKVTQSSVLWADTIIFQQFVSTAWLIL